MRPCDSESHAHVDLAVVADTLVERLVVLILHDIDRLLQVGEPLKTSGYHFAWYTKQPQQTFIPKI